MKLSINNHSVTSKLACDLKTLYIIATYNIKNSHTTNLIGRHLIGRHAAVTAKDETEKVVPINFFSILTSLRDHSKEI